MYCRNVCHTSLCEGQEECSHSSQNGQHVGSGICDQDGRYPLHQTNGSGASDLGMVSSAADNPLSIAFARFGEPIGRPRISASTDIYRVEAPQGGLQQNLCLSGCTVCHETESPAGQLCELEPDPGAIGTNAFHISWIDLDGDAIPSSP